MCFLWLIAISGGNLMEFSIRKHSELILSLKEGQNLDLPSSAFLVSTDEKISSGHSISGVFCHTARSINDISLDRICDFIVYENIKNRRPCIAVDETSDVRSAITERLNNFPKPTLVRNSDPKWIVHATSFTNGKAIIADGKIKSQKILIDEKYLSNHQLGYSQLREPIDYLDHINFAVMESIWPEAVVSSNQSGSMGEFDEHYNPGFRFYIDAHDLIKSGLVVRTGAPFLKVAGALNLNGSINYHISKEIFEEQTWTPRTFTVAANEVFKQSDLFNS